MNGEILLLSADDMIDLRSLLRLSLVAIEDFFISACNLVICNLSSLFSIRHCWTVAFKRSGDVKGIPAHFSSQCYIKYQVKTSTKS